jgi:uroporphyrin-III C-methyltransferase
MTFLKQITRFERSPRGCVTLVGAGPGDVELLTLKAINAIKRATVLLVDDLVNSEVLTYASPHARIVQVGKRGGCVSTPQSFIEKLMILAAKDGENVVRLKGGDPFVFGRGGEEVDHLRKAGVKVEVINGITSGLAACTTLGIPLTHRAHAHGVVFVTGHNRPGDMATDWAALSTAAHACQLTLVIYMGISGVASIQQGLLSALPPDTPAAVIQRATLPDQKSICCTLARLESTIKDQQMASPSIIVVGNVVRAANALAEQTSLPSAMAA